ncbi:hypothetical protein Pfo_017648 [Paulownia fortunei]|nr:hypothetical protein Pfo_017648 [Paulownia fortunei]
MRIRKHAKISPLVYAASSLKPGTVIQTHVCQLNQSPWDVMSFSPPSTPPRPPLPPRPPSQVNESDVCAGNGSSLDTIPVLDREFNASQKWGYCEGHTTTNKAVEQQRSMKNEPIVLQPVILCCKTDGKSWHCRREAVKGNSLCQHHLTMMRNYSLNHSKKSEMNHSKKSEMNHSKKSENSIRNHNNLNHSKKSEKSVVEAQHGPRPKRAPTSTSSNPYEFYYYSGFGPSWGKKRGQVSKDIGGDTSKNVEHDHELNPSLLSQFDKDIEYIDDENEDEENETSRKKKARKPIKARSLKSLM